MVSGFGKASGTLRDGFGKASGTCRSLPESFPDIIGM